jgi:hypothetical protein
MPHLSTIVSMLNFLILKSILILVREVFRYGLTHFYNMVKRRPSNNNELRTIPLTMNVHKYVEIRKLEHDISKHWNIQSAQPFFPGIEKLFKTDELDVPTEYGLRFKNEISGVVDDTHIRTVSGEIISVHKKVTMMLSPFKWMQGEYGSVIGLPSTLEQSTKLHSKIQDPNNSAYIGAIVSAVLSESDCIHFPKVYGVISGISKKHTIDISDDYEELCERSWFSSNIGKSFDITLADSVKGSSEFQHTRKSRIEIQLGEDVVLDGVEVLNTCEDIAEEIGEIKNVFDEEDVDDEMSDSSSVSTSYVFGVKSCGCSEEEDEIGEDDDDEPFAWASFQDVPVQMTLMETCSGTLYELLMKNPDTEKHLAWMTQVIFALAFAQRNFAFTHNDLHANNVMYVPTENEFLYYNNAGTMYRVPTYGYLIKLIDFERGTAAIKLIGMKEPKIFMTDHFSPNEEAGGQYNHEPYYFSKYPSVKPNPSFDLARLATSLFWDLFPEGPKHEEYSANPLFQMFIRWLSIDDGSVLFGKKDVKHDRYHGFNLYKAIARFCKNAIPRKEIVELKSKFGISNIPLGESICTIEA